MKITRSKFLLLASIFFVAGLFASCSRTSSDLGFNLDNGQALGGYDAVAYFAIDKAVKGDAKYEYVWRGAKWLFSSEENMKKFQADPEAYAPQFGGYCSYAVSEGYTANGDPEAWKVVDGKLYLNYSPEVKVKWEKDQEQRINNGRKNWQTFATKKPQHKG